MIKSMTGFGKEVLENEARKITIEIRTLNSKQLDLNLRLPQIYREKELDIRSIMGKNIERGKVDISINIEQKSVAAAPVISKALARHYYNELKEVSESINQSNDYDYLSMIVKMPEVLVSPEIEIDDEEFGELLSTIQLACDKVNTFRINEGKTLEKDFIQRINTIIELLQKVDSFEENRTTRIRERIKSNLEAFSQDVQSDKNRFEQEVIYYLEKLDITEEKIRLKKHCDYFLETLSKDSSAGKKLGFVSQEIGREINTMGAKANDFDIQQIVVLMKDELEKIKEQLFNIL
ncbi:MAG: YicC family protein [Marinilabiliales bacterium]|nr:MAG: YicC family protein [Marinilabiliales bacterium]